MFDGMITDMESNKKLSPTVTELFLRRRKLYISLVLFFCLFVFFFSQSYFEVPKTIRLYTTHYSITKIPNKKRTSSNRIKLFV